jgi:hypothetical protein
MLLLELAAQAVRGFSPSVRVALKPGYIGLKSPTDIPAPLGALVLALCYPDGRGGDATMLAPGSRGGRAGLSIQGHDHALWRLVRDLGGSGGLHKLNPKTNQYDVITQDASEVAQVLRTAVGFPARATYEQLFTFVGAHLPTRRPKQLKAPAAAKAGPKKMQSSAFDAFGGASNDQPEERLAQLEKELAQSRHAAELQFKLDGTQADIFREETRLKAYNDLRAKVDAARKEMAEAPSPKSLGLPDDILERVRRSQEDKKRRDEAMIRLHAEREEGVDETALRVEPLYRDRRFWSAVGVGIAFLVAGAMLDGNARLVSLLSIPACTVAALLALRFVENLQRRSREHAKLEVFTLRDKKIQDEFQLSTSIVQTAFDKTNTMTAEEFAGVLAKREELLPQVGELELALADFESDPEIIELPVKIAELKTEFDDINRQLLAMSGGYVREVREVERDIARLKESLAPPAPVEEFSAVATGPTETFEDPMPGVLLLATDLFATDVPTLWGVLHDRAVQYFKALSDQRYHGIDVGSDGRATVAAPGRSVAASELPGRDLDLLYLSVRLTVVEKYSAQNKLPVIIEDSFGSVIDASKQNLLGRMLKHLGTLTQVLHVTGNSQVTVSADAVVQL